MNTFILALASLVLLTIPANSQPVGHKDVSDQDAKGHGGSRQHSQEMVADEEGGSRRSSASGGGEHDRRGGHGRQGGQDRQSEERFGGGRETAFSGMDKVTFDKGHEDTMKQQTGSELELEKEDSHKRDKTHSVKETMMKRNPTA